MSGFPVTHPLALLDAYDPGDDALERESVRRMRLLVETADAPFAPDQFDPGHVTASALVLAEGDRVLLVRHPRLGRWLQPGGHLETEDASLWAGSRREVAEETGLTLPATPEPPLVRVDVHDIPATDSAPAHTHHDFMFGFRVAGPPPPLTGTHEAVWAPFAELNRYGVDAPLRRGAARARVVLSR